MNTENHIRITTAALEKHFSPLTLAVIIAANLGQDALRYQIGHDHFHYDNNSFAAADSYIESQHQEALAALAGGNAQVAWQAFGRLTHTAQDFYAHSNYVDLWRDLHPVALADEIQPQLAELLTDSRLISGRIYYPVEVLAFIPALRPLALKLLPRDSHAHLNKDYPGRPNFELAYHAAVKRTELEFDRLRAALSPEEVALLAG